MNLTASPPVRLRQRSFFDEPTAAPHNGSSTSRAAAEAAEPKLSARMRLVLDLLGNRGHMGATIDELADITGLLVQSVCPVVNGLVKAGLVRDSGQRRTTRSGCAAKVWIAAEGKR